MKTILPIIIIMTLLISGGIYIAAKDTKDKQVVEQSHHRYTLALTSQTNNLQPNKETTITYKIIDEKGNILKDFSIEHTKVMHFIIVRKDLQDFQHLHPDFHKDTDEFTIPITFPETGAYRLFADFTPANGQKDIRGNILNVTSSQDVTVGDILQYNPQDLTPDTTTTKTVGDYQIEYSLPKQIHAKKETKINLHVSKNGKPVTDMQEYLGALAHGILLKQNTLNFAHLHDMGMGSMQDMNSEDMKMTNNGPDISFTYTFPSSGMYKLFTQFQVASSVVTTELYIRVEN